MDNQTISGGVVHPLPDDLRQALQADSAMLAQWQDITPLARNEWICWIEDAKRETTRHGRITRARENLTAGKRRPCCWPGCPTASAPARRDSLLELCLHGESGVYRLQARASKSAMTSRITETDSATPRTIS